MNVAQVSAQLRSGTSALTTDEEKRDDVQPEEDTCKQPTFEDDPPRPAHHPLFPLSLSSLITLHGLQQLRRSTPRGRRAPCPACKFLPPRFEQRRCLKRSALARRSRCYAAFASGQALHELAEVVLELAHLRKCGGVATRRWLRERECRLGGEDGGDALLRRADERREEQRKVVREVVKRVWLGAA